MLGARDAAYVAAMSTSRRRDADASNLANSRTGPGLAYPKAAAAGVKAYTWTGKSGRQVWVLVRNGLIENAGVNPVGAAR